MEESHSEGAESEEDVKVNRDLFIQHDSPIGFFLHESIKNKFSRRNLTRDIERHGGIVLDTDIGCDTVLVDVKYDKKETLQNAYNVDDDSDFRKVFVEFTHFVQHCIQNNLFVHRIPPLKGMGGTAGPRMSFTESDDENLSHYLARILPDKAAGGRSGIRVYKKLVEAAEVRDAHEWSARHTLQSWRERYKKNVKRFDKRIEDIVKVEGRSRKQLWPEDRRASQNFHRGKHKYEPEEEPSEGDYEEERPQPSRKRQRSHYSPPPPNRRRVVHRSSDRERKARAEGEEDEEEDGSERRRSFYWPPPPDRWRVVQRPSDEKGKARAEEEEAEEKSDESDLYEYLFSADENEPGPSRSRRSLEATTVAAGDLNQLTQPFTASFFTQETVVASAPSGRNVQSKENSHLLDEAAGSSSLVRPSIQVTRGAKRASPSGHEPLAVRVIDLTSPSRSTGRNSPVSVPPPVGEVLANEIEVEKILIEDEDEEPDDASQVRGVSLDTDDVQTEQNLRPTQPIPSHRMHPSEILKEFKEHSAIWTSQSLVPLTGRSHLSNNRPAVPVRNTQENSFRIPSPSLSHNVSVAYKAAEPSRTPLEKILPRV